MSAFMCDDAHISALAAFVVHNGIWSASGGDYYTAADRDLSDAEILARKLRAENEASLSARYLDPEIMIGDAFSFDRDAARRAERATPVEIIVSAQCYQYQACEHDGWENSRVKQIVDAIIGHAISRLPGYRDARWGEPGSDAQRTG